MSRICIDIDDDVVESMREYATANGMTVEQMVEIGALALHAPERLAEKYPAKALFVEVET